MEESRHLTACHDIGGTEQLLHRITTRRNAGGCERIDVGLMDRVCIVAEHVRLGRSQFEAPDEERGHLFPRDRLCRAEFGSCDITAARNACRGDGIDGSFVRRAIIVRKSFGTGGKLQCIRQEYRHLPTGHGIVRAIVAIATATDQSLFGEPIDVGLIWRAADVGKRCLANRLVGLSVARCANRKATGRRFAHTRFRVRSP
jgi:hypothetical protein